MTNVSLRPVCDTDLDIFFEQSLDPEANHMAAFVGEDPTDRGPFDRRWAKIRSQPTWLARTIVVTGDDGTEHIAGTICSFEMEGDAEVTYWLGREFWGKGIATRALELFLQEHTPRPIFGRAAKDNIASIRVLEKCGFTWLRDERGYAPARGKEIDEVVMVLP
ncbi:MAG: GNAT family N-acetyltransferase [Phycisphaerales bacterium]|nr:GNAT family N-acetyltransferase [Phycisphaerales bacterium]